MISTSISHYDILEELGRGGMGIVYKAHDQKLGRTVALKLLSESLSGDPEAKSRFLHEGRAASALDHSNICTIYEIGESDEGQLYMAMAYVEGRSLADLIAEGPLGLERTLGLAVKIGEGLAHSHLRSVVHRDLKPSNVIVSDTDDVKILDFGLARILGATQLTVSGTTLGTAAYMSPEQAQGQRADHRTDIWSLGIILYEMVAGVRPFRGEYQQAISYGILNEDPEPLTALRTGVPIELDRIIFKALEKDPDDRYQHVEDMLVDLRRLMKSNPSTRGESGISKTRTPPRRNAAWIPWTLAVVATIAAIFIGLSSDSEPPIHFSATIETGSMAVGAHPLASVIAIAPDGGRFVYARQMGASSILVLRSFSSFAETALEGTEGGHSPFFSPDGDWIGFMAGTKLKKVELETGKIVDVAIVPEVQHGGSWGLDGTIVLGLARELATVSSTGGALNVFARIDSAEAEDHFMVWPQVIPGSEYVLCTTLDQSGGHPKIWTVSRRDGTRTFVTNGGNARYLTSGHLVFPQNGSLWIADFDASDLLMTSDPVITQGGVLTNFSQEPSLALYDISETGVLVFVGQQGTSGTTFLSWVGEDHPEERVSDVGDTFMGVHLSPDGKRLVTTRRTDNGGRKVYMFDIARDVWTPMPVDNENFWPHWTWDGRTVFMTHEVTTTTYDLVSSRVGSVGYQVELEVGDYGYQVSSWIPGSQIQLLQKSLLSGSRDFDIVRYEKGSEPIPFIASPYREVHAAVSPDGKWVAYAASIDVANGNRDTEFEVFVRGMESPEPRVQVSQGGGWAPKWSRTGQQLFYEADAAIMVVDWPDSDEMRPTKPGPYFTGPFARSLVYGLNYDVGLDGRLLVLLPEAETRNVRFVTAWLEEHR